MGEESQHAVNTSSDSQFEYRPLTEGDVRWFWFKHKYDIKGKGETMH
jgi:hypothetical protein